MNYFRTTRIGCALWLVGAGNLAAQSYTVSLGALADQQITSSTTSVPVTLSYTGGTTGAPTFNHAYSVTFSVTVNGAANPYTICFVGDSDPTCSASAESQTAVQLPLSLFSGITAATLPVGGEKATIAITGVNVPSTLGLTATLTTGSPASVSAQMYAPLTVTPGTPAAASPCVVFTCSSIVVAIVQGGDAPLTVTPAANFVVEQQSIFYSPSSGPFSSAGQITIPSFTVKDSASNGMPQTVTVTVAQFQAPVAVSYSGGDIRTDATTPISVKLTPENLPNSAITAIASGTLTINGQTCTFDTSGSLCASVNATNQLQIPLKAFGSAALPVGGMDFAVVLTSSASSDSKNIALNPDTKQSSITVHLYDPLQVTAASTITCGAAQLCSKTIGTVSGGDGTPTLALIAGPNLPAGSTLTLVSDDATHKYIQFSGTFSSATPAGNPLSLAATVADKAPVQSETQPLNFSVSVTQNAAPVTMQYTGGDVLYGTGPIQVQLVVGTGLPQGLSGAITDGMLMINKQACSFSSQPSRDLRRGGRKLPGGVRTPMPRQSQSAASCGTIDPGSNTVSISQTALNAASTLPVGGTPYTITLMSADAQDPNVTLTVPTDSSASASFQLYQPLTLQAQASSCTVNQTCTVAIATVKGGDGMLSEMLAGNPSSPTVNFTPAADGMSGSIMLSGKFTTADATPGSPAFQSMLTVSDMSTNSPVSANFGVDVLLSSATVTLSSAASFNYTPGGSISLNLSITSSLKTTPTVTSGSISINNGTPCTFSSSSGAPCGSLSGAKLSIPMSALPGYDVLPAGGTQYTVTLVSIAGDTSVSFSPDPTQGSATFILTPGNAIQLSGSPTLTAMVGQPLTPLDLTPYVTSKGTGAGNLRFVEISDSGFTPVALSAYGLSLSTNGLITGSPAKATVPSAATPLYASIEVYDAGSSAVSTQSACAADAAQCRVIHVTLGILPALTSLAPSVTNASDGSSADATKLTPGSAYNVCLSTGSYAGTVTVVPAWTFSAPGARTTGFVDPNDQFPQAPVTLSGATCTPLGATLNSLLAGTYTLSFSSVTASASDGSGTYTFSLPPAAMNNFSQTFTVAQSAPTVTCTLSAANSTLTITGSTSTLQLGTLTINVATPTLPSNTTYTPPAPNSWTPDFATAYKNQTTTSQNPDGDFQMTVLVGLTETNLTYKVTDLTFTGTLSNNGGSKTFSCSNTN